MKLYLVTIIDRELEGFTPEHFASVVSMEEARQKALDWLNSEEVLMDSDLVWTLDAMMDDPSYTYGYDEQELEV